MHIIGILKLATCFSLQVVQICGKYWIAARIVEKMPRKLAQDWRRPGAANEKYMERIAVTKAWRMQIRTTITAVRYEGDLSVSLAGSVVAGVARGK